MNNATDLEAVERAPDPIWQTNALRLEDLKASINAMGRTFAQLEQVREEASPIEQRRPSNIWTTTSAACG